MAKQTRRAKPNARDRVKFYKPSITTDVSGELKNEYVFHSAGYFALEKPLKPREVLEGARNINEQTFILIGQWTRLVSEVTHGMIAFIVDKQKLFAVDGNATDPWGDRSKCHVYVVDNVLKDVAAGIIPGL